MQSFIQMLQNGRTGISLVLPFSCLGVKIFVFKKKEPHVNRAVSLCWGAMRPLPVADKGS